MARSWEFSKTWEALDRIQYHVTLHLSEVYRAVAGLDPLTRLTAGQLVIPALTVEDLGIDRLSSAVESLTSSAGLQIFEPDPWSGLKSLRTTLSGSLDPMSVFNWARDAKTHLSRFASDLDLGARTYLNIENLQINIASGGSVIVSGSTVEGSFNHLSALAPPRSKSLLLSHATRNFRSTDLDFSPSEVEPSWELVRPRVRALGETLDIPRPARLAARELFGLRNPERELIRAAVQDVVGLSLTDANEIFASLGTAARPALSRLTPRKSFFDLSLHNLPAGTASTPDPASAPEPAGKTDGPVGPVPKRFGLPGSLTAERKKTDLFKYLGEEGTPAADGFALKLFADPAVKNPLEELLPPEPDPGRWALDVLSKHGLNNPAEELFPLRPRKRKF